MSDNSISVIYISGWARSGTTLMDTLLGQVDGFFSAGELRYIWDNGIIKNRLCGCGRPHRDCDVWRSIAANAFGSQPEGLRTLASEMVDLQRKAIRLRRLPVILRTDPATDLESPTSRYARVMGRLYGAIAESTGSSVIVDSSKAPQEAALLTMVPGVRPFLVHLVRDPRGVARSMQRVLRMQESSSDPVELEPSGPVSSSLGWLRDNLAIEIIRPRYAGRSLLVRYEDLANDPRESLGRVVDMVAGTRQLDFLRSGVATVGGNHTVWGNPARFKTGEIRIRPDAAWHDSLSRKDKLLASTVSLPLLRRYHYQLMDGRQQDG